MMRFLQIKYLELNKLWELNIKFVALLFKQIQFLYFKVIMINCKLYSFTWLAVTQSAKSGLRIWIACRAVICATALVRIGSFPGLSILWKTKWQTQNQLQRYNGQLLHCYVVWGDSVRSRFDSRFICLCLCVFGQDTSPVLSAGPIASVRLPQDCCCYNPVACHKWKWLISLSNVFERVGRCYISLMSLH